MLQLMYDSVSPAMIPQDAANVAGYGSGRYRWALDEWRRFGKSSKFCIMTNASAMDYAGVAFDCFVLDVERYDATPEQAPDWVVAQRKIGRNGRIMVYCGESNWQQVQDCFAKANVPHPYYWVAWYNNAPTLLDVHGAVAKQFIGNFGGVDLSIIDREWGNE